jgi:type VII secretion protein EccB
MIHDPMRGQMRTLAVGMVIAVLITGAAGILAFFKPTQNFGGSTVMLSKADGGLFVRIGDRLRPALNSASARLITGKSDLPQQVEDNFLNTVALGPAVGIVGAPSSINGGDDMTTSSWTACDSTQLPSFAQQTAASTIQTTVLANDPVLGDDIRAARSRTGDPHYRWGTTFLIFNGVRAALDPTDLVLHNALRLDDSEIREVSPGLLNSFPLVDPITPIGIPGVGEPTGYLPATEPVGAILRTVDSRGEQLYVVLREGLQPISAATARHHSLQQPSNADDVRADEHLACGAQRRPNHPHAAGGPLSGQLSPVRRARSRRGGVHVVATRQLDH